eukprot:NODE_386_length_8322_cov_0.935547.p4 type:complete len:320 gc:universal NODE_386_length_8322_cov_0.935547:6661-5702(-)
MELAFDKENHLKFIQHYQKLQKDPDVIEIKLLEHLTMSAYYWAICAMKLLTKQDLLDIKEIEVFVIKCQHPNGGFGGSIGHDPHLLYTLSAVQILVMIKKLDKIQIDKVVSYIASLQQSDGSFVGDDYKEVDTRFSYCAISALSLLKRLDAIDIVKAVAFIMKCHNFDGGFGSCIGSESHGGQIFTCVAALKIAGRLDMLGAEKSTMLGWWLSERQLPNGGLNGRPEKKEDVCYSWWNLSSLEIITKLDWINKEQLRNFILRCQHTNGGICHRENQIPDLFHTLFGITGLSLLGYKGIEKVNPSYCMPQYLLDEHFIEN